MFLDSNRSAIVSKEPQGVEVTEGGGYRKGSREKSGKEVRGRGKDWKRDKAAENAGRKWEIFKIRYVH